jgi:DNA topoisomerase-1
MAKALVIVESPAKAKTINQYLGKDYIVKSSIGHIRDLPPSGLKRKKTATRTKVNDKDLDAEMLKQEKEQKAYNAMVRQMGLDPENGWEADYVVLPDKEKVLKELKVYADKAEYIFLATDLDREGEAIAWHLQEVIGGAKEKYRRVIFQEITKKAIQEAFKDPGVIDMHRVHAQQARRFLDRVVGYMLSPLLWKKIARGLSAGRVQSVAVRLIVEKEKEINAFIPIEYWEILANLEARNKGKFKADVFKYQGEAFKPKNEQEARKAKDELEKALYKVINRQDKPTKKQPNAPFITSTLQQTASIRMGFSVKKTMTLAQRLYEAGYITYMRTDSTVLSADAQQSCRDFIHKKFGENYLPAEPNVYKSKKTAQEAHEAIRPSDVSRLPEDLSDLEKDQMRLYTLIWQRFVACQMAPAEYDSTTISIEAGKYELKATGRIMRFDGWLRVMPPLSKKGEEDVILPDVKTGEVINLLGIEMTQHFTKPPARFNEASLVKELEKRGIGRPSTYASIISTIQERGYVRLENKRFFAEKMGEVVVERLIENFNDLMDFNFTAGLEAELDTIAQGNLGWKEALDRFYGKFKQELAKADLNMRMNIPTLTEIPCPTCGKPMMVRIARTGVFLACSGYNAPVKERCKTTINLIRGEEVVKEPDKEAVNGNGNGEEEEDNRDDTDAKALMARERCPVCSTAMDNYLLNETQKIHICGNNPDCLGYKIEEGKFRLKGYDGPVIQCDKCGADMQLKTGRFGKFFGCTNYPACNNTRKLLRNGEAAPPREEPIPMPELKCTKSDGYFILRDGAAGLFLASNLFPKSRETRSPLVEDLIRHKSELAPKYLYLTEAPAKDPSGNKTVVRYKRKEKVTYVMTERDSKATGWAAYYQSGKWVVENNDKPSANQHSADQPSADKHSADKHPDKQAGNGEGKSTNKPKKEKAVKKAGAKK